MTPDDDRVDAWLDDDFAGRWRAFARQDTGPERPPPSDQGAGEQEPAGRESASGPRDLAVVEQDLPGHLFGFTRRGSDHVTVNRALYRVDRESTIRHEKMHHRTPKDELTVRYLNGDLDVENTLSFRANHASRVGRGNRAGVPVAARSAPAAAYRDADGSYRSL